MKAIFTLLFLFLISTSHSNAQTQSKKRGIAYNIQSEADMAMISKGVSWWYNWYFKPDASLSATYSNYKMSFVPMAWGSSFDEAGLRSFYASHPDEKYLLAFNEPNFTSQSNLTPSQVAALWPKLEKIAADYNLKIVGPAVNYCDKCVTENGVTYTDPIKYLDAFFADCPNCQVDYIAVHNYMCYSGALSSYVNQFKKYNRPIWLTEFACWDQATITLDMQKSLVLGALDYLEGEPSVFRYSWFSGDRSGVAPYINLFDSQTGKLSELGNLYINYNPIHDPTAYAQVPARIEAESYTAMSGISIEAVKDIDGIADVGWIDAGDWLDYNIDVPTNGNYTIYFRIASNANTSLEVKEGNLSLATLQIPSSGGWQNWKTLQTNVVLTQGYHTLRIYTGGGQFNFNWLYVSDHQISTPVASAGTDKTISSPTTSLSLNGTATSSTNDALSFLWTKVSGPEPVSISGATSLNPTINGLQPGSYIFNLAVSNGIEKINDQVAVTVLTPTGLSDKTYGNFKLYPNPVNEALNLEFNQNIPESTLCLIDEFGRELKTVKIEAGTTNFTLDFSSYKKGTYIVRLKNASSINNRLIVK